METIVRRNTKQKELIKNLFIDNFSHPTREEIYLNAKTINNKISRSTVYRLINELENEGLLTKIVLNNNEVHYDPTLMRHDHFYCKCCHKIYDINSDIQIDKAINLSMGKVDNLSVVYYGTCCDCLKKDN